MKSVAQHLTVRAAIERGDLTAEESSLRCRIHPAITTSKRSEPATLIYLPGLHGDWTLLAPFRQALAGRLRLVEFTYPRRTDWNLAQYAGAVLEELAGRGIFRGWILGESFSSQTAWAIARRLHSANSNGGSGTKAGGDLFDLQGLILAGGFIRHPVPWGVWLAGQSSRAIPAWLLRRLCGFYCHWARRRCAWRTDSGVLEDLELFAARRLSQGDREAITSRYRLIQDEDLRPIAGVVRSPVYFLSGGVDPIVPWPAVVRWLRRRCPGYRGKRIIWGAGHAVLLDAPEVSAEQIVSWLNRTTG